MAPARRGVPAGRPVDVVVREGLGAPRRCRRSVASVAREAQTIQFDGKGFSGTVTLDDERVVGEVRLGLMTRPLKGVITRQIEAGLDRYLAD